jgi:hypothetical protein
MKNKLCSWMFVLALFCLASCSHSNNRDGRQLYRQMLNAMGGADRIRAVHDFEEIEEAQTWFEDGKARGVVRKHMRFIRPSFLRIDQVGAGDTYVLYFDGEKGWEILPDKPGVIALSGGELRFAQGYLNGISLNSSLQDDPDVVYTSPAPYVIDVSTKSDPTHVNEITLDPDTFLQKSGTGISLADPDHPVKSETLLAQWEDAGGVKFARRITNLHAGKKLAEITVKAIKINSGLKPEDLAMKPSDLKPVMSY